MSLPVRKQALAPFQPWSGRPDGWQLDPHAWGRAAGCKKTCTRCWEDCCWPGYRPGTAVVTAVAVRATVCACLHAFAGALRHYLDVYRAASLDHYTISNEGVHGSRHPRRTWTACAAAR